MKYIPALIFSVALALPTVGQAQVAGKTGATDAEQVIDLTNQWAEAQRDNGKLLPEVLKARQRGILLDSAQGVHHLAFDVTEKCLQQNFLPDTIGTDLSVGSVRASGFDLPSMVSKFLALGMDLNSAVERVTIRPASVFDYGLELGTLRPGNEADIAIFELREGQFEFFDSEGQMRMGHHNLLNAGTVRRGQLYVDSI